MIDLTFDVETQRLVELNGETLKIIVKVVTLAPLICQITDQRPETTSRIFISIKNLFRRKHLAFTVNFTHLMDSAEIRERRQSDDTRGLEPVERGLTIKWTGIDSDT